MLWVYLVSVWNCVQGNRLPLFPELGNKISVHRDGKQQFRVELVSRPGSELQTQTFQKFAYCCLDPALFFCFSFHLPIPFWPYISTLLTPPEAQSLQHLYVWTDQPWPAAKPNDAHWMAVNHIHHLLTQVTSSSNRSCFSKMQRNLSSWAQSFQCSTLLESVFWHQGSWTVCAEHQQGGTAALSQEKLICLDTLTGESCPFLHFYLPSTNVIAGGKWGH